MKRSTTRILTTHTGSLPRPPNLVSLLMEEQARHGTARTALDAATRHAVAAVVHQQAACGLDVINDGEQGRVDYTVYIKDRLTSFDGESAPPLRTGDEEFPELAAMLRPFTSPFQRRPACTGPVAWAALSFPAANPRHEHEWKIWKDVKLPDGKVIIPGVIDSTSNFVEHPELVAERIVRYANVVGRERLLAGVDCGFGTFAGKIQVDSKIVWLKLQALTEGARLASRELW